MKNQTKWIIGGAAALGVGYYLYKKGKASDTPAPPVPEVGPVPEVLPVEPPAAFPGGGGSLIPGALPVQTYVPQAQSALESPPTGDGKGESAGGSTTTQLVYGKTPEQIYQEAVAAFNNLANILASKGFYFAKISSVPRAVVPMSGDPWGAMAYLKSLPGADVWNIAAVTDKNMTQAWFIAGLKVKPSLVAVLRFVPPKATGTALTTGGSQSGYTTGRTKGSSTKRASTTQGSTTGGTSSRASTYQGGTTTTSNLSRASTSAGAASAADELKRQITAAVDKLRSAGLTPVLAANVPRELIPVPYGSEKARYDYVRQVVGPKFKVEGYTDQQKKMVFVKFTGIAKDTRQLPVTWLQMRVGSGVK